MKAHELLGTRIGSIRVVDLLGHGGMGAVYLGFDETLERKVALKAIRSELRFEPESKARFLQEARILSRLAHPNICLIHDFIEGDDTDFLVLELIEGRTLRELGDELPMAKRLKIVLQVAEVLRVAHEQGIVHRDLKPDNVMLTDKGDVKVLDFGLSRSISDDQASTWAAAIRSDAADSEGPTLAIEPARSPSRTAVIHTTAGVIMGTLGYMSPEQARGESATPASDVYSLGLMAQQLLGGGRPYPEGIFYGSEMVSLVARGETRSCTTGDDELNHLVERMKAPEAALRPSAEDVVTRLRSVIDRPQRQARRRLRIGVVAAALAVAAAMAGLALRARHAAAEARRAQAESEKVTEFLVELFEAADPMHARGVDLTVGEVLHVGVERLEHGLADLPAVHARLQRTIGGVYLELGAQEEAEALLKEALERAEAVWGPDHRETAVAATKMAWLHLVAGRGEEGAALARRAVAVLEELSPDAAYADALNVLGNSLNQQGLLNDAEAAYRQALAVRQSRLGPDHPAVAATLANLGNISLQRHEYGAAEASYRQAAAIDLVALGAEHPGYATDLHLLGLLRLWQGDAAGAEPLLRQALEIRGEVLPEGHQHIAESCGVLAEVYEKLDRPEEGLEMARRGIAAIRTSAGGAHPTQVWIEETRTRLLLATGDLQAADLAVEHALAIGREAGAEWSSTWQLKARILRRQGREDQARQILKESLKQADAVEAIRGRMELADLELEAGHLDAASSWADEVAELAADPERTPSAALERELSGFADRLTDSGLTAAARHLRASIG